jgi:hypothetical protein
MPHVDWSPGAIRGNLRWATVQGPHLDVEVHANVPTVVYLGVQAPIAGWYTHSALLGEVYAKLAESDIAALMLAGAQVRVDVPETWHD